MNSSNLPSYSIIGNGLKNQSDTSVSFGKLVMSFSKMTFFAKKNKIDIVYTLFKQGNDHEMIGFLSNKYWKIVVFPNKTVFVKYFFSRK